MIRTRILKLYIVSDLFFYRPNMAKMRPFLLRFLDLQHTGHIFDSFEVRCRGTLCYSDN